MVCLLPALSLYGVVADARFGSSEQCIIKVWRLLGTAVWISRDALLEPSVLRIFYNRLRSFLSCPLGDRFISARNLFLWARDLFILVHNLWALFVVSAVEGFAGLYMDGFELCLPLPAKNEGVYVERIELQSVAATSGTFGNDHGSSRTEKRIEAYIYVTGPENTATTSHKCRAIAG
jgi:hypothetical protein